MKIKWRGDIVDAYSVRRIIVHIRYDNIDVSKWEPLAVAQSSTKLIITLHALLHLLANMGSKQQKRDYIMYMCLSNEI